jgi:hypothetical protein
MGENVLAMFAPGYGAAAKPPMTNALSPRIDTLASGITLVRLDCSCLESCEHAP